MRIAFGASVLDGSPLRPPPVMENRTMSIPRPATALSRAAICASITAATILAASPIARANGGTNDGAAANANDDPEKAALIEQVRRLAERVDELERSRSGGVPGDLILHDGGADGDLRRAAEKLPASALSEAIRSIQVTGFVEVLGSHNLRTGATRRAPGAARNSVSDYNRLRGPDSDVDGFSLQTAQILVEKPLAASGTTGFRLRADYGRLAEIADADPLFDGGTSGDAFDVREAHFTWRTGWRGLGPCGDDNAGLDIAAGKFRSPLGFETLENTENWLVTRNPIAVFGTPVTHTGVRFSSPVADKTVANVYFVNGWDDVRETRERKTGILNLVFGRFDTLSSQIQVNASYGDVTGAAASGGSDRDDQRFLEVVWDGRLDDATEVALDAIAGDSPGRRWRGAAAYVRHKITPSTSISARAGWYGDDAIAVGGAHVADLSVAVTFELAAGLTAAMEWRHDRSGAEPYLASGGSPSRDQDTVTLSLIARF